MGKFYDAVIENVLDNLEKDARRIMEECVEERDYEHRTHNLYDSYGYGVYLNGKVARIGYLSASPTATKSKRWYGRTVQGRGEIERYLKSQYTATGAIDAVIVAAMPYARVLEEGGGGVTKMYKVISMSFQKLQSIAAKYKATVKAIK